MKKIVLVIMALVMSAVSYAQDELDVGVGGGFGFTEGVDKRLTGVLNINLGFTFDSSRVGLGIYFTGFGSTSKADTRFEYEFDDCEFRYCGCYGGAYVDKRFLESSFFYCKAGVKLGFGGVNYSNHTVEDEYYDEDGTRTVNYEKADKCFVMALEPYGMLNFRVGEMVTISGGVEYRNLLFTNLHCSGYHIAGGNDLNGLVYLVRVSFCVNDF